MQTIGRELGKNVEYHAKSDDNRSKLEQNVNVN